jgi:hypothetical protein
MVCAGASDLIGAKPMTSASLAFGLVLLTASGQSAPPHPPINTLQEIGPALTACWKPPSDVQNYEVVDFH